MDCPACCVICKAWDRTWLMLAENDVALNRSIKEWVKTHLEPFHSGKVKSHKGNGAPQGAFAFTLTMSPKDGYTQDEMITAVRKIMGQQSCPVKRYAWYLEYGNMEEKTHPHIHGMYETEGGGRIERKHFKRAWPLWDESQRLGAGFRGGYHRPVRDGEAYNDYIAKGVDTIGIYDSAGL